MQLAGSGLHHRPAVHTSALPQAPCRTPAGGYHSRAQHIRLPAQHFTAAPCRQRSSSAGLQQRQQQQHGRQQLRVVCQAATDLAKFANQAYLDKAAQRFRLGVEQGLEEDFLVAVELGVSSRNELTEAQLEYADRIKDKLARRAAELAAEEADRKKREATFLEAGKLAYERGQYEDSVSFLERAVEKSGKTSIIGGEALMWLALAYQACGREEECINTYKWLEDNHPVPKVKKQAADLRYIMEAPKMELSPEERVTIPLLNTEDSWVKKGRKSPYTPRYGSGAPKSTGKKKNYWDTIDWDAPLRSIVPDKWYVRVAWLLLIVGIAVYVNWHYGTAGAPSTYGHVVDSSSGLAGLL